MTPLFSHPSPGAVAIDEDLLVRVAKQLDSASPQGERQFAAVLGDSTRLVTPSPGQG